VPIWCAATIQQRSHCTPLPPHLWSPQRRDLTELGCHSCHEVRPVAVTLRSCGVLRGVLTDVLGRGVHRYEGARFQSFERTHVLAAVEGARFQSFERTHVLAAPSGWRAPHVICRNLSARCHPPADQRNLSFTIRTYCLFLARAAGGAVPGGVGNSRMGRRPGSGWGTPFPLPRERYARRG